MIEELLEAILKGGQAPARSQPRAQRSAEEPASSGNPWMDILEGVLKGAGGGEAQPPPQESDRGQQAGVSLDLSRLLEIFLGGGRQRSAAANPTLAPFVEALSEKLGISPQLAATIVNYAFSLIVSVLKGNAQQGQAPTGAPNLDHLLDGDFLDASGLSAHLAQNTGMDPAEARVGLRTALEMLSKGYNPEPQPVKQPPSGSSKLQHLLDEW